MTRLPKSFLGIDKMALSCCGNFVDVLALGWLQSRARRRCLHSRRLWLKKPSGATEGQPPLSKKDEVPRTVGRYRAKSLSRTYCQLFFKRGGSRRAQGIDRQRRMFREAPNWRISTSCRGRLQCRHRKEAMACFNQAVAISIPRIQWLMG